MAKTPTLVPQNASWRIVFGLFSQSNSSRSANSFVKWYLVLWWRGGMERGLSFYYTIF